MTMASETSIRHPQSRIRGASFPRGLSRISACRSRRAPRHRRDRQTPSSPRGTESRVRSGSHFRSTSGATVDVAGVAGGVVLALIDAGGILAYERIFGAMRNDGHANARLGSGRHQGRDRRRSHGAARSSEDTRSDDRIVDANGTIDARSQDVKGKIRSVDGKGLTLDFEDHMP